MAEKGKVVGGGLCLKCAPVCPLVEAPRSEILINFDWTEVFWHGGLSINFIHLELHTMISSNEDYSPVEGRSRKSAQLQANTPNHRAPYFVAPNT